jgi:hypothetical protein
LSPEFNVANDSLECGIADEINKLGIIELLVTSQVIEFQRRKKLRLSYIWYNAKLLIEPEGNIKCKTIE